jgi:hypothetical protein
MGTLSSASNSPRGIPGPVRKDRNATVTGAISIFREIGVTADDLRQWAPWCPALGELADALDAGKPDCLGDETAAA